MASPSNAALLNHTRPNSKSMGSHSIENSVLTTNVKEEETTVEERVEKLYEDLGGCGCFQVLAYFGIAWGMSGPSWFIYEVGYLTQEPDYICEYDDSGETPECNKENICSEAPGIKSWDYDYNSEKTLHNWQ